jgi:hypothetical protein
VWNVRTIPMHLQPEIRYHSASVERPHHPDAPAA